MFGSGNELLVILVIAFVVFIIFGASKFKNLGKDLGTAIKDFRTSIRDDKKESDEPRNDETSTSQESVKTN